LGIEDAELTCIGSAARWKRNAAKPETPSWISPCTFELSGFEFSLNPPLVLLSAI
jgi:hypothetical protein